jgi:hypothetical protein
LRKKPTELKKANENAINYYMESLKASKEALKKRKGWSNQIAEK